MKRIIVCCDGTWNKPNEKDGPTNVSKFHDAIKPVGKDGVLQTAYYHEGVGTSGAKTKQILDGITGDGLDNNIKDAYEFVASNYEDGDEIYLFGFSRGAYTARSVAGFIRNSGLLKKNSLTQLDHAFEYYRDRQAHTLPDSEKMKEFKTAYCFEPRIRMVGVWDTVGALGIPLNLFSRWNYKRYAFHDVMLSRSVDFAYHALALQERRISFSPTLWEKCAKEDEDPLHPQVLQQVWFSGVHSNVGGGYPDTILSDAAYKWMAAKAITAGLNIDVDLTFPDVSKGVLYDSATWYYKLLGLGWRSICDKENRNEAIHHSITKRPVKELPPKLAQKEQYKKYIIEDNA